MYNKHKLSWVSFYQSACPVLYADMRLGSFREIVIVFNKKMKTDGEIPFELC